MTTIMFGYPRFMFFIAFIVVFLGVTILAEIEPEPVTMTTTTATKTSNDPIPRRYRRRQRIDQGWQACRSKEKEKQDANTDAEAEAGADDGSESTTINGIKIDDNDYECWDIPSVPTTALLAILEYNNNKKYKHNNNRHQKGENSSTSTNHEDYDNHHNNNNDSNRNDNHDNNLKWKSRSNKINHYIRSPNTDTDTDTTAAAAASTTTRPTIAIDQTLKSMTTSTTAKTKTAKTTKDNNDDIYFSNNLLKFPDISSVGRDYYTLVYQWKVPSLSSMYLVEEESSLSSFDEDDDDDDKDPIEHGMNRISTTATTTAATATTTTTTATTRKPSKIPMRQTIRISGINYRAQAFYNGQPLNEIYDPSYHKNDNYASTTTTTSSGRNSYDIAVTSSSSSSTTTTTIDGMFRRRHYNIPMTINTRTATETNNMNNNNNDNNNTFGEVEEGGIFQIRIEPPLHPGNPMLPPLPGGQGGDHSLAKDGPTAQFMLGWDWCQAMPDRSTGFFGSIDWTIQTGPLAILDPTIQTLQLQVVRRQQQRQPEEEEECKNSSNNIENYNQDNFTSSTTKTKTTKKYTSKVVLAILAHIECVDGETKNDKCQPDNDNDKSIITLTVTSDWGEVWKIETLLQGKTTTTTTTMTTTRTKQTSSSSKNHVNATITTTTTPTGAGFDIQSGPIEVEFPEKIHPWWPHGIFVDDSTEETAYLHSFQFDVEFNGIVSDSITIQSGIRTVETYLDPNLQGQVFSINHEKMYLVGGNWIATDQALRYSSSKDRYCNELALFRHAGLNLVRIWGGGVAETTDFYECADQLGLVVFQEFWMTGDNNGRWAGNYSWPLNHETYLANVHDTVRRLRRHPSLLFYGGCNECLAPRGISNPPIDIDNGIRNIINTYDPGRFYISSSMGGKNKGDTFEDPTLWANRSFSLAFADGPYGYLMPEQFFERNPGLEFKNISIGFQPEIGSTSAPTYAGLLRFMTKVEAEQGFPQRKGNNDKNSPAAAAADVGDVWDFHKFQDWTSNNGTYDHVYAYLDHTTKSLADGGGGDDNDDSQLNFKNASEWCAAAQLASYKQHQHLFEGFISHIFDYTSTVIMWKAQSPWPSLRGFLYDWYLEATGTFFGTRAALGQLVSLVFDVSTWNIWIVNRSRNTIQLKESEDNNDSATQIMYEWISIEGITVESGRIPLPPSQQKTLPPMTSILIDSLDAGRSSLTWPIDCDEVCFLHLTANFSTSDSSRRHTSNIQPSKWYWVADPTMEIGNEYAALGRMRSRQNGHASLNILNCNYTNDIGYSNDGSLLSLDLQIQVPEESLEPSFYPTISLYAGRGGAGGEEEGGNQPILPIFDSSTTEILILPGETQHRTITSPIQWKMNPNEIFLTVQMDSWNGKRIQKTIQCANISHGFSIRSEKSTTDALTETTTTITTT